MRKHLAQQLLRELLRNSKRSDRELAEVLGVSQPTITRTRHKLEREGAIQDYTVVPDFRKMGFEIMALTFVKMHPEILTPEMTKKVIDYAEKEPDRVFASAGEGLGMTGVIISFHKNYTEYHKSLNQLRVDWKDLLNGVQTFIISIGEKEFKRFSLACLADVTP